MVITLSYMFILPPTTFLSHLRGAPHQIQPHFSLIPTKMPRNFFSSPWGFTCTTCTPGYACVVQSFTLKSVWLSVNAVVVVVDVTTGYRREKKSFLSLPSVYCWKRSAYTTGLGQFVEKYATWVWHAYTHFCGRVCMLLFDLPKLLCPNTTGVNWSVLSAQTQQFQSLRGRKTGRIGLCTGAALLHNNEATAKSTSQDGGMAGNFC